MSDSCPVCSHVGRFQVEQAYLDGSAIPLGFSRREVERHMGHLVDAESLRAVAAEASAVGMASRLRRLEHLAMEVLGMAVKAEDTKVALSAVREVRQTIEVTGRLAGHLAERTQPDDANAGLDAALARALGQVEDPPSPDSPTPTRDVLALGPGPDTP